MKKILQNLLVMCFIFHLSSAQALFFDTDCCDDECYCDLNFSVVADYAAFFPLDDKVSRIYGSALPQFTLECNWQFCECWGLWLDGSYVFGNGHALGCGGRGSTHLDFAPISIGFKYNYALCDATEVYLGLGACYSFLNIRDHSPYVHEKTSVNNSGAIIKTGLIYRYCDGFFFHGFFNYMYQKFYFHKTETDPFVYRNDVNLSSLQLGIGVGLEF